MMRIIDIKVRRKMLCEIEFDREIDCEEYGADKDAAGLLAIDSEICEIKGLKPGVTLNEGQLCEIVRESHIKRAKSRAMWYMSRGDCSRKTMYDKLKRSFPEYACAAACDRLEELGLLNDAEYAVRRLQRIIETKKVSKRMAKQLLKLEGISAELVDEADEVTEYDPIEPIVDLINKKYKSKLGDREANGKVIAALMRKGHSYSDIREALLRFDTDSEYYCEDC